MGFYTTFPLPSQYHQHFLPGDQRHAASQTFAQAVNVTASSATESFHGHGALRCYWCETQGMREWSIITIVYYSNNHPSNPNSHPFPRLSTSEVRFPKDGRWKYGHVQKWMTCTLQVHAWELMPRNSKFTVRWKKCRFGWWIYVGQA